MLTLHVYCLCTFRLFWSMKRDVLYLFIASTTSTILCMLQQKRAELKSLRYLLVIRVAIVLQAYWAYSGTSLPSILSIYNTVYPYCMLTDAYRSGHTYCIRLVLTHVVMVHFSNSEAPGLIVSDLHLTEAFNIWSKRATFNNIKFHFLSWYVWDSKYTFMMPCTISFLLTH